MKAIPMVVKILEMKGAKNSIEKLIFSMNMGTLKAEGCPYEKENSHR